eukprot:COSAG01_NODE_24703_length_770_cov_0.719821_1_plen_235_part_01
MTFRLAIWYQGESNALWGQFPDDAHTGAAGYSCRYTQLIRGYRAALRFVGRQGWLTVQIAPWLGQHSAAVFPSVRLAQQVVGDAMPGVATVVTQDLGDPLSPPPAGSMHPRDKYQVGSRLAAAALALSFIGGPAHPERVGTLHSGWVGAMNATRDHATPTDGAPPAAWGGPTFVSITRDGPAAFTVQLGRAAGLRTVGARGCGNVSIFDDGSARAAAERCCAAPDTFRCPCMSQA